MRRLHPHHSVSRVTWWFAAPVLLFVCSVLHAQAPADPGFDAFAQRLGAAAGNADAEAVADLTRLPFLFEGRALDRQEFVAAFLRLFTDEVRSCLAKARFLSEGPDLKVAFCPPYAFYFGVHDGRWQLFEFAADGESD